MLLLFGGMAYLLKHSIEGHLRKNIEESLDHSRKILAMDMKKELDAISRDVLLLSHSSQVSEAIENSPDLVGVSSYSWSMTRKSVDGLFESMMMANPSYVQIRLIGMEDQGLEWARVDRKDSVIKPIPMNSLQPKGHRSYFQEALRKKEGEIFISRIELNREHDQIVHPRTPVIRVATPIYHKGKRTGLIIINVDIRNMMKTFEFHLGSDVDALHLANDDHEVVKHSDPQKEFLFEDGKSHHIFYDLEKQIQEDRGLLSMSLGDETFYSKAGSLHDFYGDSPRNFHFILGSSSKALDAVSSNTIRKLLYFLSLICLLYLLIQLFLISKVLSPVTMVAKSFQSYRGDSSQMEEISQPKNASQEIKYLVEAYNELSSSLNRQNETVKNERHKSSKLMSELLQQRRATDEHAIVSFTDAKGVITYINKKFELVSGYSKKELIGKNHRIINSTHHSREFFKELWSTISHGSIWHGEVCNRKKNGEIYWVLTTIYPFRDEDGKVEKYVSIRTDITDNKLNEERLLEAKEKAQESSKAKSQFLSVVSHEMRTPLNAIKGFSELLLSHPDDFELKERNNFTELIYRNSGILTDLINDLLDLSKLESQKMELHLEPVVLTNLLDGIDSTFKAIAKDKEVNFNLETQSDLPTLSLDRLKINQILINLTNNAIKFSPKGRSVILRTKYSNGTLTLEVEDEGIGIPEDKQSNIFSPFTQAESSISRKYEGTGLGLSICQSLVELMQGKIELKSALGVGSTFTAKIPASLSEVDESDEAEIQDVDPVIFKGKSILIVEDNLVNLKLIQSLLKHLPSKIYLARNGEEGVEEAIRNEPSIILMDIHMPRMDGFRATQIIREHPELKDTPIIAVTADSGEEACDRAKSMGMNTLISKPISKQQLLSTMSRFIGEESEGENREGTA